MRMWLLIVLAALIQLGCTKNLEIHKVILDGQPGENWVYPDREYVIFENNPSITEAMLLAQGFSPLPVDQRGHPEFDEYPGRFGIGIDQRETSLVFEKNEMFVILADGRLTAESKADNGSSLMDEIKAANAQQVDPVGTPLRGAPNR